MSATFAIQYKQKMVEAILRANPNRPGTPIISVHNVTIHDPRPIGLIDHNTAIVVKGVPEEGIYGSKEYYYNRSMLIDYLHKLLYDEVVVNVSGIYLDTLTYQMVIDIVNTKYNLFLVQSDFDVDLGSLIPMNLLVDESKLSIQLSTGSLMFYGPLEIHLITSKLPNMINIMDDIIHQSVPVDPLAPPGPIVPG